ncbi:MAG: hypothetical protein WAW07_16545 [Bacteroidales bacterium]
MSKSETVHMKNKARKVLEVFPSFHELMNNHGLYKVDKILFRSELKKYSSRQEWEGVALAADKISSYMNGREFWKEYDFDTQGNGSATVFINPINTIEVGFETFLALIILFYISSIDFRPGKKQYLAWREFTNDEVIRKILE